MFLETLEEGVSERTGYFFSFNSSAALEVAIAANAAAVLQYKCKMMFCSRRFLDNRMVSFMGLDFDLENNVFSKLELF